MYHVKRLLVNKETLWDCTHHTNIQWAPQLLMAGHYFSQNPNYWKKGLSRLICFYKVNYFLVYYIVLNILNKDNLTCIHSCICSYASGSICFLTGWSWLSAVIVLKKRKTLGLEMKGEKILLSLSLCRYWYE